MYCQRQPHAHRFEYFAEHYQFGCCRSSQTAISRESTCHSPQLWYTSLSRLFNVPRLYFAYLWFIKCLVSEFQIISTHRRTYPKLLPYFLKIDVKFDFIGHTKINKRKEGILSTRSRIKLRFMMSYHFKIICVKMMRSRITLAAPFSPLA